MGVTATLRDALDREKGIKLALLFGSAASGSEGPDSDIDLLVVGPISLGELLRVTRPIQETLAKQINPVVMTEGEFRTRQANNEHFISSVLAGETVTLVGELHDAGTLG